MVVAMATCKAFAASCVTCLLIRLFLACKAYVVATRTPLAPTNLPKPSSKLKLLNNNNQLLVIFLKDILYTWSKFDVST